MKISVTISFADLVTNSCLPLFLCLLRNQNKNQNVSNFVYSESCSTSKQCRIQQTFRKEFSCLMFLFVLQFCDKRERFAYSDTFLGFLGTKNKHAVYSTSSQSSVIISTSSIPFSSVQLSTPSGNSTLYSSIFELYCERYLYETHYHNKHVFCDSQQKVSHCKRKHLLHIRYLRDNLD